MYTLVLKIEFIVGFAGLRNTPTSWPASRIRIVQLPRFLHLVLAAVAATRSHECVSSTDLKAASLVRDGRSKSPPSDSTEAPSAGISVHFTCSIRRKAPSSRKAEVWWGLVGIPCRTPDYLTGYRGSITGKSLQPFDPATASASRQRTSPSCSHRESGAHHLVLSIKDRPHRQSRVPCLRRKRCSERRFQKHWCWWGFGGVGSVPAPLNASRLICYDPLRREDVRVVCHQIRLIRFFFPLIKELRGDEYYNGRSYERLEAVLVVILSHLDGGAGTDPASHLHQRKNSCLDTSNFGAQTHFEAF